MNNFWQQLDQPIIALAPLAGVSDSPFRQMCKNFGADVVYSEMASATALVYNPAKTLSMLISDKTEQPFVIQLFGSVPEHFAQAVKLLIDIEQIRRLGIKDYHLPAGFDINLGCPVPKVLKQTAGCELFKNLKLSHQVIEQTIANTDLPVSIKIRSQVGDIDCLKFLDSVSDLDIKAVMIHGRTYRQGFVGEIDYQIIKQARNYFSGIILANGGINTVQQVKETLEKTKADGLGIARGAFGRPWIFEEIKTGQAINKDQQEIFKLMIKHAKLAKKYADKSNISFREIRKHLGWYVSGLENAKQLRQQLMVVDNFKEIKRILKKTA